MPCRVSFVKERYGKIPMGEKNAIYIEYDNYLPLLSEYLPEPLNSNPDFVNFIRNKKNLLDEFAD